MEATSLRFAAAARDLAAAARRLGLDPPAFRSPPGRPGLTRTLRRRRDGGHTAAIAVRGRPWPAVLADMIDAVVTANNLAPPEAHAARDALWQAVLGATDAPLSDVA